MRSDGRSGEEPALRTLELELDLVRDAIAMVASGGSPRVSLGGLHFGEQLVESAQRLAAASGVRVVPLWNTDEGGAGLAIERAEP